MKSICFPDLFRQ